MSVTVLFAVIGCGDPRSNPLQMDADAGADGSGSDGLPGASGGAPAQTGGVSGTGGTSGGSGGRSGTGGASASGGSSSGGASTGGVGGAAPATGGAPGATGGNIGTGGMGTGGVVNTGGHGPSATGGTVSSGGVGTGGAINTGGHGPSATGGTAGTGGLAGTGGKGGTGGTGTGTGTGGAPADPCLNNGGCNVNATCAPATGGRTCTCKTGYSGDGMTCNDTNECLSANGGCDTNAVCTNTVGSRTCACATGYTGNGLTCTVIPPPAPISIWKFEKQTNPNTILDSAGSNPGTVVTGNDISTPPNATSPIYVADRNGVANGALRLDGVASSNWVLIPSSSSLNAPWTNNAITVTFWVRMKTVPPSGGATLFDRGGNADPAPVELSFFNGNPYLSVKNASVEPNAAMPTATWTFLAGVYDGTNLVLYVNGNVASSFPNAGIQMTSGTQPAAIGAVRNTSGPYSTGFIDGDIDEVRLYGAGLTAPQIKTVMQQ
ncbi:MAG TPA: LamG-like jellyroll fold domain-containing protein [Polyangia bacterium]|jgi:hypothetical protein